MSADLLDTNVFVNLFDNVADAKRERARALVERALTQGNASISYQVIQETLNVVTTRMASPMTADVASEFLRDVLLPLWDVMPSADLYDRALAIHSRHRLSFYDSLIVAAALGAGCTRLLTEDLQDGQVIEGMTIKNPFRA